MQVWMLPGMLPQHPGIAKAMLQYRYRTMPAAIVHAKAVGLNGTKWAWESAFSGNSATGGDCQEIHLQAGIAMAIRSYFRSTHDLAWMRARGWPMMLNIVSFVESRVAPTKSGLCAAAANCLSLNGVESPNEYAAGINNDIYTNAAFASVLQWASVVAALLGEPGPDRYAAFGDRIIIPFNKTLNRHEEYSGAPVNLRIKQATMTMVPFPVGREMSPQVQQNDLVYEAAHIGTEGPAMTHSMLAIDWLQMRNKTAGDAEFSAAFDTNLVGPFLQWMECPIPPDYCQGHRPATNFMTAAGGFLQAVIYGYGGVRYNDRSVTLMPALALNATRMALHALNYRGAQLRADWTAQGTQLECVHGCALANLCASSTTTGPTPLTPSAVANFAAGLLVTVAPCHSSGHYL